MTETYVLSNGVDHGWPLRAAVVDMKGQVHIRRWDETASASLKSVVTSGVALYETSGQQTLSDRLVGAEATHLVVIPVNSSTVRMVISLA